jgi:hypothetical protein
MRTYGRHFLGIFVLVAATAAAGTALGAKGKGRKRSKAGSLPVWIYDPAAPTSPPEPAGPARAAASVSEAPLVLEKAPKAGPTAGIGLSPKPEKLPESPALIEAPPAAATGTPSP